MSKYYPKKKGKKIVNAKPQTCDGIYFRSGLEVYTYKKFKENKIKVEYEPTKFILLPKFEYDGKKIRQMTYTPDFIGNGFIVECKGRPNEAFPLRWKIFQWYLKNNNITYKLYKPSSRREVDQMIEDILQWKKKNTTNQKDSQIQH